MAGALLALLAAGAGAAGGSGGGPVRAVPRNGANQVASALTDFFAERGVAGTGHPGTRGRG